MPRLSSKYLEQAGAKKETGAIRGRYVSMDVKNRLMNAFAPALAAARARDSGDWEGAATLYAALLARTGRNTATFRHVVQLGNCQKEAGRHAEALATYDDAVRINSRNSDLHLQRGHLFKLMGNAPASAWAYQQAYNLDPGNVNARFEIEESGAHAVAGIELPDDEAVLHTVWFDVTDFVDYARHNISLSGIQRVCGNLMLSVAQMRLHGYRVVPVLPDYDTGRLYSVRYASFVRLTEAFREPKVSREEVINNVTAVMATRSEANPGTGDTFFIVGAFWIVTRYDWVAVLRRKGVKFGLFIHDLIQIRNPDFAMPDVVDQFAVKLLDATELCDFVLTNSRYVRDDVRVYLRQARRRDLPVIDVPLPTALSFQYSRRASSDCKDLQAQTLFFHDYVLVVSTIEVRKNHALLIRIWEKLRDELGVATPHLVFVGKWGWQIDALRAYIENQGYEGDWLYVLNNVSDMAMESLYKGALFTVYPSFAEGFGLPIGESLSCGTPCIASGTTAMPEVGGGFVRYFDPFDWTSALPVIRGAIVDREDLRRWQQRIAADFKPRQWGDFCSDFYRALIACAEAAPDHTRALTDVGTGAIAPRG